MIEKRKKPRFLRKDWHKCIRLGGSSGTKKKRVWRRSRGRHGKLRQKWKGRQKMHSIGYGSPNAIRGMIKGMNPVMINNLNDLMKVGKDQIGVVSGKMGTRKRIDLAKKASTMNLKFANFNVQKYLEMEKKPEKKAKEEKK